MMMVIKIFHLNTLLNWCEYLCLKMADILPDVVEQYKLATKATEYVWIHVEIRKGMYGLSQAGLLAQELLEQCLANN